MTQILPGLFQLKIPIPDNPLGHTNIYLIRGDDGALLIDAGFDSAAGMDVLESGISRAGASMGDIRTIVITHAHGDHVGLAGRVRDASGARLAMHRLERPRRPRAPEDPGGMMRQHDRWARANGVPRDEMSAVPHHGGGRGFSPPAKPDMILQDGDRIEAGGFDLTVVWTPGHSPGHVCLYEASRKLLFSADHILPVTTPNIGLRPGQPGRGNPLSDYLRSLDKVGQLDAGLVLPAHEGIFSGLSRRADEIKEHHRQRSQEILDTLSGGPKSAYEVSAGITWLPASGGVHFNDLGLWNRRMAVSETLAHLETARLCGDIRRFLRDGVVYYQRTAD